MATVKKGSSFAGIVVPSKPKQLSSMVEIDKIIEDILQTFTYLIEKLKTETQWATGMVTRYAGSLPNGFLECDGSSVSRVKYADLFREIGTTYGVGDGSTTFDLPALLPTTGLTTGELPFCIKY